MRLRSADHILPGTRRWADLIDAPDYPSGHGHPPAWDGFPFKRKIANPAKDVNDAGKDIWHASQARPPGGLL
jgi:hypothetical protein